MGALIRNPGDPIRLAVIIATAETYWRGIVRGIARLSQDRPAWKIRILDPRYATTPRIRAFSPDAIIAAIHDARMARGLLSLQRPVINISYFKSSRMTQVGNDDEQIGAVGAQHLLQCGFRSFAYLGQPGKYWADQRRSGFEKALCAAGQSCTVCPAKAVHHSARLTAFLRGLPRSVAVMTSDDLLAVQVTELCGEIGRRVPDDVAVLGVNNDEILCSLSRPELSSVELAVERIGMEAATRAEAVLTGREPVGQVIELPPLGVAVRRSTDVLAISDETVAAAVRYIRTNAFRPLSIEDVLAEVSVSRSSLQRRFSKSLGHSPYTEIRIAHVEIAKRLLADHTLPLKAVAKSSGLVRPQQLSHVFSEVVGLTPATYRKHVRIDGCENQK